MELYNDFESANEAAKKVVKANPGRIVFIMNKDRKFTVIVGWDGRDQAIKDGWRFS
jgi:hypothetical protein